MTKILELQLAKAISSNIVTKQDAIFVMKIVNLVGSIEEALKIILHYSGSVDNDTKVIVDGYSIREHKIISSNIRRKISEIDISEEEINNKVEV